MANMNTSKNVTVIPARKRVGNNVTKEEAPKLRVAAYCRVSTDTDEQATSYEAQVERLQITLGKILNGNLQAYLLTMAFQAQIQKREMNSTG